MRGYIGICCPFLHTRSVYHRTIVPYHTEGISPVPQGTDIIEKVTFVYQTKVTFSCERVLQRCVNVGKKSDSVRNRAV
jgi:hypothetical protein